MSKAHCRTDIPSLLHDNVMNYKHFSCYRTQALDASCKFMLFGTLNKWLYGESRTLCPLRYDDVIKWKHLPCYWPFVRGSHRSPVNSPHKGQWRGLLMFSLICAWIYGWVKNNGAGDMRRQLAHYDAILMWYTTDIDGWTGCEHVW